MLTAVRCVPPPRVVRKMREVLNLDVKDSEKILKIIELLDEQGIQEAKEPKPLPVVALAEVRLVAWMAVGKSLK